MSLDEKISKYLDGELSEEEDFFLRHEVSKNPDAREKFNASVGIHLALREDAESVEPPEDLVKKTEDIVLMKILARVPDAVPYKRMFSSRRVAVLASFVVLFLLGSLFKISDLNFKNPLVLKIPFEQIVAENNTVMSQENNRVNLNREPNSEISGIDYSSVRTGMLHSNPNVAGIVNTNDRTDEISSENKNSENTTAESFSNNENNTGGSGAGPVMAPVIPQPVSENSKVANNNDKRNSIIEKPSTDIASKKSTQSQVLHLRPGSQPEKANSPLNPVVNGFDMFSSNDEIVVSSYLGTDFIRSGISAENNTPVTHFSQSIGYAVNKNERLGIEVGYTEYAYNENIVLNKPLTVPAVHALVVNDINIPSNGSNNLVSYPATLPRKMQLYWGSAFYEHSIVDIKSLSLNGRVGIGASSDGPLGYGRLIANYDLFSGFSLSLGTEGRIFMAQIPILSVNNDNVKKTVSLLYGIQFKF